MDFDPVELAERFEHVVVADAEAAAKHASVKAVLLTAAQALLPGIDLPQDAEDVTALLRAAGEIAHAAIDRTSRKAAPAPAAETPVAPQPTPAAEAAPEPPAPPEGFEETGSPPAQP